MFGYLAVESDAVAAVVVSIKGLTAEATACIPDGHCLVRGSCAEIVAEGLPTHLIHRVYMAPVCSSREGGVNSSLQVHVSEAAYQPKQSLLCLKM